MFHSRKHKLTISEDTLPERLSALLRAGVEAMDVLDHKRYAPDSAVMVHDGAGKGACRVTLAGALLATRFGADIGVSYHWADLTGGKPCYAAYKNMRILSALSEGNLREALFMVHEGLLEEESEEAFEYAEGRFQERVEGMSPELRGYLESATAWSDERANYSGWERYDDWREHALQFAGQIEALGG